MNMGGPNNLDEVEVFLKNMFNDKYIIGAPQPIRALIAKLIIYKRLREPLIINYQEHFSNLSRNFS